MKHYAHNPRQITAKEMNQLKKDLAELGDLGGFVHDLNTDEIIGGNQRSEAIPGILSGTLKPVISQTYDPPNTQGTVAVGFIEWEGEQFKYRAVRWDDKTRQRANIRANKAGGAWDWDELINSFEIPDLLEFGFNEDFFSSVKSDLFNMNHLLTTENYENTPPSLDSLKEQYGEPQERDFWPFIRVQVSPETMKQWNKLMDNIPGEDEAHKIEILMGAVDETLLSDGASRSG